MDTEKTTPNNNHNANSPAKPNPDSRLDPETRPMTMTPKKNPTELIVSPGPITPQRSKCISHTYTARILAALLVTKGSPKHRVEKMEEKRYLNIFEDAIKIETSEQTNPSRYIMPVIDT